MWSRSTRTSNERPSCGDRRRTGRAGAQAAACRRRGFRRRASIPSITEARIPDHRRTCRSTTTTRCSLAFPTSRRSRLLRYLLENGKHVLVEKPLWATTRRRHHRARRRRARTSVVCYTAYNHRFEPHYRAHARPDRVGRARPDLSCRMFYGNGTARLVRNSEWRDQGAGVLPDLGSHLLDTCRFWFGDLGDDFCRRRPSIASRTARPIMSSSAASTASRARTRDDAAQVAQPFHLRRPRRERHRRISLAVQMGTVDLHPAHARPAERPPARGGGDPGPGRSDLGGSNTRISKGSAGSGAHDRSFERSLAASRAASVLGARG